MSEHCLVVLRGKPLSHIKNLSFDFIRVFVALLIDEQKIGNMSPGMSAIKKMGSYVCALC